MPDFTMCTNSQCGLTDFCWRFQAPPELKGQSFQKFEPDYDKNECKFFKKFPGEQSLIELYKGEMWP